MAFAVLTDNHVNISAPMKNYIHVLCLVAGLIVGFPPKTHAQKKAIKTLIEYLEGDFNNSKQVEADKKDKFLEVEVHIRRIWADKPQLSSDYWIYMEQTLAIKPTEPYRQCIFKAEYHNKDTFVLKPCTLPNPERYVSAFKDISRFNDLKPSDLRIENSCAIYLRIQGRDFKGGTLDDGCKNDLRGATYVKSVVKISEDKFTSEDQGIYQELKEHPATKKVIKGRSEIRWGLRAQAYIFDKLEK